MTDRAASTTLSYVLTLSIATILVGGLIVAGSSFVEDRREQVIRQELQVVGEHLARNVDQVDRYVRAGSGSTTARIEQAFPDTVTGSTYNVRLRGSTIHLNATQPEVSVSVPITSRTSIAASDAGGGTIVVEFTGSDIEIHNDN